MKPLIDKFKHPALFLFVSSALLFWPIFTGHFILGGTDVLFNHFPNLLFGLEHFQEFGEFPLWNPYIFAGRDMTGSMQSHYLNPIFWPLLIFSKEYIFHGLTIGYLIAAYISALCWYNISRTYKLNMSAATVVSLTSIYGTFFWFATTTLIAVPMFMFSSVAAFLITRPNFEKNTFVSSFQLLFCLTGILLFPHPGYITGFCFLILGAIFAKLTELNFKYRLVLKVLLIVLIAFILALLLSAYRIFPVISELVNHGNVVMGQSVLKNEGGFSYYILPLINLYSVGTSIGENFSVLESLNINAGRHHQFHTSLYYGILPLLLICSKLSKKIDWWTLLLLFIFIVCVSKNVSIFAPLNNLVGILMFPVDHDAIYRIASHLSFLALLINCLKPTPDTAQFNIRKYKIILMLFVFGFFVLQINIWYALYHKFHPELFHMSALQNFFFYKISFFAMSGLFITSLYHLSKIEIIKNFKVYIFVNLTIGLMVAFIVFILSKFINLTGGGDINRFLFSFSELLALVITVRLYLTSLKNSPFDAPKRHQIITAIWLFIAILLVIFRPSGVSELNPLGVLATGIFGFARFLILIAVFSHLLIHSQTNFFEDPGNKRFLIPIFLLIFLDLLGANRIYTYVNTDKPYVESIETVYPQSELLIKQEKNLIKNNNYLIDSTFKSLNFEPSLWQKGGNPREYGNLKPCGYESEILVSTICFNPDKNTSITLFQDVSIPKNMQIISLGGWFRLNKGDGVKIYLTSPSEKSAGESYILSEINKWVWVNISIPLSRWRVLKGPTSVRPHLEFKGETDLQIRGLKLTEGPRVIPESIPKGTVAPRKFTVNKNDYRFNRVTQVVAISDWHEIMANYSMVYKIRAYSGVDSDMRSTWIDFLKNFKELDPSWFHRAGLLSTVDNDRFLDLLGVKYDIKKGNIIERANPMSRFMSFNKVIKTKSEVSTLKLLKSASFKPLNELIIKDNIDYKLDMKKRAGALIYKTHSYDHLEIDIEAQDGRIIFFGDTYSKNWRAKWNGTEIPIHKANSIFMAVNLPDGDGNLTFSFKPKGFIKLTYIAISTFSFIIISFLLFYFWHWRKKVVGSLP